jgi:hypothetical protein
MGIKNMLMAPIIKAIFLMEIEMEEVKWFIIMEKCIKGSGKMGKDVVLEY